MAIRDLLPDLWSPVKEMNRLQRRMGRTMDEFFGEPLLSVSGEIVPACDVEETDSQFLMSFDLPGVKKEDIKIEQKDNQLTVSGERREEHTKDAKGRKSQERYYGTFFRSFTLPNNANMEKVEARFENGVLQLSVPKTAVTKGKQIPVKGGKLIEGKTSKAA